MDAPIAQPESPYEASRRIENLVRLGTVAEVRLIAPARVRVKCGDNVTDWLPWATGRAGGTAGGRKWHPPIVGEQCLLICPGGDMARGVALLGVYSDPLPQGSSAAGCERTDWDDHDYWQWLSGALEINLSERCTITVAEHITLTLLPDSASIVTPQASIRIGPGGAVTIKGGGATLNVGPDIVNSNVDVVAAGISLKTHRHGGVESGSNLTAKPEPEPKPDPKNVDAAADDGSGESGNNTTSGPQ